MSDFLGRAFERYWRRRLARARDLPAFLARLRARRATLEAVEAAAEARLRGAEAAPALGPGEVWAARPAALDAALPVGAFAAPPTGTWLGSDLALHHDAAAGRFAVAQRPAPEGPRRFGLCFEAYEFDGAYVSFAFALAPALRRPGPGERVRLRLELVASRPMRAFPRLAYARPGLSAAIPAEGEVGGGAATFAFDPGHATPPILGDDALWLDLVIDRPRMAELRLLDLRVSLGAA